MKIGITGCGVVGRAVAGTLAEWYTLVRYDKFARHDHFDELASCEIVFITVPTPFDSSAEAVDDSAVTESLERLKSLNFQGVALVKSTLPPGSCEGYAEQSNLRIAYNPEFLRESTTPNEDFKNQECIVVGTPDNDVFMTIKQMYERVAVPQARYYHLSFREAEMVKYAQNTMLASRVVLANMIYDACEAQDINYDTVREIAFDSFDILGPHMVQVPGPDGKRGFGGKCLPKDVRGFSTIHDSELLRKIIEYNDSLRDDLNKFLMNFKKS